MNFLRCAILAAAYSATLAPGLSEAQGNSEEQAIVVALIENLDSISDDRSALLAAFVNQEGPLRTQTGAFARLPTTTVRHLTLIDPPSDNNSETLRGFTSKARTFSELFSIGEPRRTADQATVTVHRSQPLPTSSDLPPMVGITTFEYTLTFSSGRWRVVGRHPVVSATGFESSGSDTMQRRQFAALAACRHLSMQQVIACAVPEYGGFYFDSAQRVVWLRDTSTAAAVTPIIRLFFGMDRGPSPRLLKIVKAKYTYNQLEGFYKKMGPLPKGVTSIAIGGRCNCVEIGSMNKATDRSVRRLIKKLELPDDAFSVERRTPAIITSGTSHDYQRLSNSGSPFTIASN